MLEGFVKVVYRSEILKYLKKSPGRIPGFSVLLMTKWNYISDWKGSKSYPHSLQCGGA